MKGDVMSLVIQTFPLQGKTLYYVQCQTCKKDKILNSVSNISNMVSYDAYRRLCGCTCTDTVDKTVIVKEKAEPKKEVAKKAEPKQRKTATVMIKGQEMTIKEIADAYGISQSTVRQRVSAGKSEEEIIAPTKKKVSN
jgi:DNA-directed RNA polymerase specialized sigma subunit